MFDNLDHIPVITSLDVEAIPEQTKQRFWLHITSDGIGAPLYIPIVIIRGKAGHHIVGITAVIHGNELNGISVVQKLIKNIDPKKLTGTIVCVPVSNVPAYISRQRDFSDGVDLNRIMPGDQWGNESSIYAYRLISKVINEFDYLIDLHTASFGNANSFYIRANMVIPEIMHLAWLQNGQIVVHKESEGTLRHAAETLGIHAITVEIGNPNRFEKKIISSAYDGILNTLIYLEMLAGEITRPDEPSVECDRSYWVHTNRGGLLEVFPKITDFVEEGEVIAQISNIFGDVLETYRAPESGIVIGKRTHPVNPTGGRILHLGIPVT